MVPISGFSTRKYIERRRIDILKITGNRIYLTRGDTAEIQIRMRIKGTKEYYVPQNGDTIRFAMSTKVDECRCRDDEETVLTKTIPIDTLILRLDPSDTKTLYDREYWYDVELTYADGRVDTFIADATIELGRESA